MIRNKSLTPTLMRLYPKVGTDRDCDWGDAAIETPHLSSETTNGADVFAESDLVRATDQNVHRGGLAPPMI
ncbi:MAG: hypothetical protein ACKVHE_28190 [Planctomycetales bacterium]|jgi:hypothetical protein